MEEWNSKLNVHGEFLALSCIACFSAPGGFGFAFLSAVLAIFFAKIKAAAPFDQGYNKSFPASARALRKRVKEGLATPEEEQMLKDIDAYYFGWKTARKNLFIYWVSFGVFILTAIGLLIRQAKHPGF